MVVVITLAAALLFAVASVLQHRNARAERHVARQAGFLVRLAARPGWLLGGAADLGGFALQVLALRRGSLLLVQPLLVAGMLFALPLEAFLTHARLSRREWVGVIGLVAGLALFLTSANPEAGRPNAPLADWPVILAATVGPAVGLVVLAGREDGTRRATMLAGATGLLYGVSAALTKVSAEALGGSVAHLAETWQLYVLLVIGGAGLWLGQAAFAAGPISRSLPLMSALDPVVSVVIGALAFGEGIVIRGAAPWLESLGLACVIVGVGLLGTSPLVTGLGGTGLGGTGLRDGALGETLGGTGRAHGSIPPSGGALPEGRPGGQPGGHGPVGSDRPTGTESTGAANTDERSYSTGEAQLDRARSESSMGRSPGRADRAGRDRERADGAGRRSSEARVRRTVLFVHGQPGCGADWAPVTERLDPTLSPFVYDRPGWGASSLPAMGVAENARFLAELARREGLGPAIVVGHSFGAAVALELAAEWPEVVGALCLVNPVGPPESLSRADRLLAHRWVADAVVPLTFAGLVVAARVLSALPQSLQAGPLLTAGRAPVSRMAGGWRAFGPRPVESFLVEQRALLGEAPALKGVLPRLRQPVIVLGGRRDRQAPPAAVSAIATGIPAATLRWCDGGHMLPWVAPGIVAASVRELSRRVPAWEPE